MNANPIDGKRKVIFVGGTSYSGSTLLDMMLANDPAGFSCGEVYALFYPYRRHHLRPAAFGSEVDWSAIKAAGPENLYTTLFERFPTCRFIIDSSKSPIWISERAAELERRGIVTENVLIWKTPAEFRESRRKRARESGWEREWLTYHRHFFTLVRQWRSVSYRELVTDAEVFPSLCSALGLPYLPGKERYWEKRHHTLFGNDTARIHLHDPASAEYASVKKAIDGKVKEAALTPHRALAYAEAPRDVLEHTHADTFDRILALLELTDFRRGTPDADDLAARAKGLALSPWFSAYQTAKLKYGLQWIVAAVQS